MFWYLSKLYYKKTVCDFSYCTKFKRFKKNIKKLSKMGRNIKTWNVIHCNIKLKIRYINKFIQMLNLAPIKIRIRIVGDNN